MYAAILVVEDDSETRQSISEVLRNSGYFVTKLETAEEAERFIRSGLKFDLMIIDLNLPGKNGLELISEAKKSGIDTPVIIITGEATEGRVSRSLQLEVFTFIVKPFRMETLLRHVENLLFEGGPKSTSVFSYEEENTLDGTVKLLTLLPENQELIELAAIRLPRGEKKQKVVCISSQTGCLMGCRFCLTGSLKKSVRNVSAEGLWQQIHAGEKAFGLVAPEEKYHDKILVSLMGMGEFSLNLKNTMEVVSSAEDKYIFAASTVGITRRMREITSALAGKPNFEKLQISLNFSRDDVRKRHMPVAEDPNNSIKNILREGERFAERHGQPTWLNVVLLDGLNDLPKDAKKLVELVYKRPFHVRISRSNGNKEPYLPSGKSKEFERILKDGGIEFSSFTSLGSTSSGRYSATSGCGQMMAKVLPRDIKEGS